MCGFCRERALFVVEHDTARPFIVSAGTAKIRAVGTQFNVYRRSTGTDVAVVEGVVQVTADGTSPAGVAGPAPPPAVSLPEFNRLQTPKPARSTAQSARVRRPSNCSRPERRPVYPVAR